MLTKPDIEKYFKGEKSESFVFIVLGVIAVMTGIVFFGVMKSPFYKGASIPLTIIGILLSIVGYSVYRRSDDDRVRNIYAYDMEPSSLRNKELPRMKKVMINFIYYRYTEIILLLGGIILAILFRDNPARIFWKGFGMGLSVMSLTALISDYFAERRGRIYTSALQSFINKMN